MSKNINIFTSYSKKQVKENHIKDINIKNKTTFQRRIKILGINIVVFLPCSFTFYLISKIFFPSKVIALCVAIISALCFYRLFFKLEKYYKNNNSINNYMLFLQALSNHLNLNKSLSLAISLACDDIVKLRSNKNLRKNLYKVQYSIKLSAPFSEIIKLLKNSFPCSAAYTSLSLMATPQVMGDNIYIFTQNTLQTLQSDEKFKKDISAEQMKSFVETLTVATMPIVILLFLRLSAQDFINLAYINTLGQLLLGASYLLFFLGLIFIFIVYIPNYDKKKRPQAKLFASQNKLIPRKLKNFVMNNSLIIISKTTLPFQANKIIEYSKLLERQENIKPEDLFFNLIITRFKFLIFALIIGISGFLFNTPFSLIILLFFAILLYPDFKFLDRSNYYKQEIKLDMQNFIVALLSALNIGYTLESALIFCEKYGNLNEILTKELSIINNKIKNSSTSAIALSEFIGPINDTEIENFFYLIQTHTQANNNASIAQLQIQFEKIKEKLFIERKKLVALKSNNYLLPLMLNLASVFLICLAPVLPSLQI